MKDYKKYLNPATKVPMIEVLANEILIEHINFTRKKISIKHYLNVYLFPTGEDLSGNPRYPLYYRVIFNKQSVKIKSAVNCAFSLQEFKNLSPQQLELLRREALTLTHIVNDIYRNVIEASNQVQNNQKTHELSNNTENNNEDEIKQSFDINQIFNAFEYSTYELPLIVERKILQKMAFFANRINQYEVYEGIFKQSKNLNSYQLLQFLKLQNQEWDVFEKDYHSRIWFFNLYYYQFINQSNEYRNLGATQIDFEYLNFKKMFTTFYQTKEFEKLLDNIAFLLKH